MNIKNKLSSLMYAPLALALLAACSSDDVLENNQPTTQGQALTINATTGGEDGTRVDFGNDGNGKYATSWQKTDQVRIYAGNNTNVGTFNVTGDFTAHNAKFTGKLTTTLTKETPITGYIVNGDVVKTSTNGVVAEDGFGKQIEVDYSEQDGTWDDAVSRCVLFGKGTYYPSNADQPVDMKFEYKTTFFKLVLNFGDNTLNTTASMCLTGDNVISKSRIYATGSSAGKTNYVKDLFINIKDVKITEGKATVYVAMYSQPVKNVYLQAVLDNNKVYDFNISNNATKEVNLTPGKVYQIERTGVMQETSSVWEGEGTEEKPYLIKSAADLKLLANNIDYKNNVTEGENGYNGKYFELTSDIIINGEWNPIGNSEVIMDNGKETTKGYAFRGIFNGAGHTISGNISIKGLKKNNCAGVFGSIGNGAIVKNITSKLNIDAHSDGDNTITTFAGGLIGRAFTNCTIENCIFKGAVTATTQFVGGLIGAMQVDGKTVGQKIIVEACRNEGGTVTNNINSTNSALASGGLIGYINGSKDAKVKTTVEVKGCYVNGAIIDLTASKNSGGIIGNIQNTIDENQTTIKACWVKSLSLKAAKGNKASIVASGKGNAGNELYFTLNNCWADIHYGKGYKVSDYVTPTDCYVGKPTTGFDNATLEDRIGAMNTVWGSSTYEFNTDGTIKTK